MELSSQDANELDQVRTESGHVLQAHFTVQRENGDFGVYLESRSGAKGSPSQRNPDYNDALWYILARLAGVEAIVLDATVESSETRDLDHASRVLRVGQDYPISIANHDPATLRLALTRAQRTIGRPAGAGPGGNNTKRIRLLLGLPDANMTLEDVRALLISGATNTLRAALGTIDALAGRRPGQSFASDTALKVAVEGHAMRLVRETLERDGWSVEDVSRSESYDLRCRRDPEELRVEVKGTRGGPQEVLVTKGEVDHARTHANVALAIVSGIIARRDADGTVETDGGTVTWHRPWVIDDGTLEPLAFVWRVPGV